MGYTTFIGILCFIVSNFAGAVVLKQSLKVTMRDNTWLKYVFIIPPFALIAWSFIIIMYLSKVFVELVKNYFKD